MSKNKNSESIGLVKKLFYTFAESPNEMVLESGEKLGSITIAYETYGTLNNNADNAILITHALSGDSHLAGFYSENDKKAGWWDFMVGPGKPFDTNKYFIICSNVLGGCMGTTGPDSKNSKSGKPYNLNFPVVTIRDMVMVQKHLIDYLRVKKLLSVIGGSMGGMQVLEWAIKYPDLVGSAIPIATTSRLGAQGIAFNEVGRQAIFADTNWKNGDYLAHECNPDLGLAVARMLAHITYLSEESMSYKFGRRLRERERYGYDFSTDFEVESYLRHQGESFIQRFDANSYLFITKAIDYFDLKRDYGSLEKAFKNVNSKFLVISFSSDWLFPTSQSKDIVKALKINQKQVSFCEIPSKYGHDSFLLQNKDMEQMISNFLSHVYE